MKFITEVRVEVEAGDTLGRIAERLGTTWQQLYFINRDRIDGEQQKRGIKPEHIPRIMHCASLAPPVGAHLIYPGTQLLAP